ncbi:hypothetical protein GCM10009841_25870 [Microlunatus panaciterrae]
MERLAAVRRPACVSLTIATSPVDSEPARLELKNLLSTADSLLGDAGAEREDVDAVHKLVADLIEDGEFWQFQANSLTIFATPDTIQTFRLPHRLGSSVEVSDRFMIKPLLRAISFPQTAFVLALAQNSVRLIEISADLPPHQVEVAGLPTDIASAVNLPSIRGRAVPGGGRIRGSEGQKVRQGQYARAVDRALRRVLTGVDLPLILAAAEPLASIYRSVNSSARLAAETLTGNPEERSDGELADAARAVLDGIYAADLLSLKEVLENRAAAGRAVTELSDIARAATFGAVETLVLDIDQAIAGRIDDETGVLTLTEHGDPSSYDVVDEIARRALMNGARILAGHADDVPAGGPVAATVRFPV